MDLFASPLEDEEMSLRELAMTSREDMEMQKSDLTFATTHYEVKPGIIKLVATNPFRGLEDDCRMDLPGPTTSVGTRTDYSVGPWDYPACATRHLMAWSTRTTEEKYSVRKLYMSCIVWKTPRRTRLVLSPYSDL
jgi:hypothetical protein